MCLLQNECGDLVGQEALGAADVRFTSANQPIHLHAQARAVACTDAENHLLNEVEVPSVLAGDHVERVYTNSGLAGLTRNPGYGFDLRMELEATLAARAGPSEDSHIFDDIRAFPLCFSLEQSLSEFCD